MQIGGIAFSDETMHVQIVEKEGVPFLTSKTGTWRSMRPVLSEGLAPCRHACPCGIRIPDYLRLLSQGRVREASLLLIEENPLAAVTGRVCPCFCESHCNRGRFDDPVGIKELEQFLGDIALDYGYSRPLEGGKGPIAVIGSGPAGLSSAYYLSSLGYQVTIFEALDQPGGMLYWGIPEYRLPRKVLSKQIQAIQALGVQIETGRTLGRDLLLDDLLSRYRSVLIACGAWKDVNLPVPGADSTGVISGLRFLREIHGGQSVELGSNVCVIGGGNTAVDSAQMAIRQGAKKVCIFYRRSREEMPAIGEEVENALREGIEIRFLSSPMGILGNEGRAKGVRFIQMELGEPDDSGRRKPIPISGSEFEVAADTIISAVGQMPEFSLLQGTGVKMRPNHTVHTDPGTLSTNLPGVFAAGDVELGPATVIQAVASGRKAAFGMNAYLTGGRIREHRSPRLVAFEDLNVAYFSHRERIRLEGPPETIAEKAVVEAQRCFDCGTCNGCNTCWFFCPEAVISESEGKSTIDYDYCKGCGICVEECPRSALVMEEESKWR